MTASSMIDSDGGTCVRTVTHGEMDQHVMAIPMAAHAHSECKFVLRMSGEPDDPHNDHALTTVFAPFSTVPPMLYPFLYFSRRMYVLSTDRVAFGPGPCPMTPMTYSPQFEGSLGPVSRPRTHDGRTSPCWYKTARGDLSRCAFCPLSRTRLAFSPLCACCI